MSSSLCPFYSSLEPADDCVCETVYSACPEVGNWHTAHSGQTLLTVKRRVRETERAIFSGPCRLYMCTVDWLNRLRRSAMGCQTDLRTIEGRSQIICFSLSLVDHGSAIYLFMWAASSQASGWPVTIWSVWSIWSDPESIWTVSSLVCQKSLSFTMGKELYSLNLTAAPLVAKISISVLCS